MTSLDDISYKLGEHSAGQAMILARLDKSDRERAEMRDILQAIKSRIDEVAEDHVWMKPQVRSYSRVRSFGNWMQTAVVGLASVVGGSVAAFALKKWGGG